MANILHILKVQDMALNDEKAWGGILASTMFALHATVYATTQHILL